jgi:acyl carrier protein
MRLPPDEISEEKELCNDLKMDSIDGTELVIECEKQFNISISDELWESVETVEDVVDVIILRKG